MIMHRTNYVILTLTSAGADYINLLNTYYGKGFDRTDYMEDSEFVCNNNDIYNIFKIRKSVKFSKYFKNKIPYIE